MLIGIDASRSLRPQRTGAERYAYEIIRHLLQLPDAARHDWRLYADRAPDPASEGAPFPQRTPGAARDNVELRVLPARRMWTHRALGGEVRRAPPDVLFVPSHVIPFALSPARLPPSVVTVHDLGYVYFPETHTRRQRLYLTWSTRWSAAVARCVIAVSASTAADLQRQYATPSAKLRVIHEATTPMPTPTPAQIAAVAAAYRLPRPYALYVGSIQPRKNIARMIEAYNRLAQRGAPDWDLVLAGGLGWLSAPLVDDAQRSPMAAHIRLPGYVADADLPALLAGARFFCYPSLFEGFGLPVLEAQAAGAPLMTANTSSLPEVAGDAALLVDPTDVDAIADAMLRLSRDEALRQRLIAAGYENVKRFSWEKAAAETFAVLQEAAQTNRRGDAR